MQIRYCGFLFIEFRSTKFPEDIDLPSLLLDDQTAAMNELENYSIAKYVNNKLVTRKGDFNYPTVAASWFNRINAFTTKAEFNHYIFRKKLAITPLFLNPFQQVYLYLLRFHTC